MNEGSAWKEFVQQSISIHGVITNYLSLKLSTRTRLEVTVFLLQTMLLRLITALS